MARITPFSICPVMILPDNAVK